VLYHGAYFPHRGLEQVIEAAGQLPGVEFVFRGVGAHEAVLRQHAADRGLESRVRFLPPVPVQELIGHAAACDVGLNPFVPVCANTACALPNKFFEYMAAGLALASTDLVEMRNLTHRHRLGVLFPAAEPNAIAGSLRELLADEAGLEACRRNAHEAARAEYHWERERGKLVDLYERACAA
jgi:glycosyltransferase involved in cell wall biosynthesis